MTLDQKVSELKAIAIKKENLEIREKEILNSILEKKEIKGIKVIDGVKFNQRTTTSVKFNKDIVLEKDKELYNQFLTVETKIITKFDEKNFRKLHKDLYETALEKVESKRSITYKLEK